MTVYVNITDNQTIGCSLIYIMEKFFVVELKPGSIAERSGHAQNLKLQKFQTDIIRVQLYDS